MGERAPDIDPEIIRFYSRRAIEHDRLDHGRGQLEFIRTQELLRGLLPSPPARVLDVGGGPGRYATWLAQEGYDIKLVDPVPALVEEARRAGVAARVTFAAEEGDARALPDADKSADAVLLLGPLYHLQERDDRLRALREAYRVVRPGGVVAASAIARFAVLLDAMRMGVLDDAAVARISQGSVRTGRHDARFGFTTAYFHRAAELQEELIAAGFEDVSLRPIEGPGWLLFAGELDSDREQPVNQKLLASAVRCARALEESGDLLEASAHILGVGYRHTTSTP